MSKKIKNLSMQKQKVQKKSREPKSKQLKKSKQKVSIKKNKSKHVQKRLTTELDQLSQKLSVLNIESQSQTKIKSPQRKPIQTRSKSKTHQIEKNIEKQTQKVYDQITEKQYKKFLGSLCDLHLGKFKQSNSRTKIQQSKQISIEWFKRIKQMWKGSKSSQKMNSKSQVIKKTQKITYVHELTVQMMKRLKPKHWLNDQVINSYIQLIETDVIKRKDLQNPKKRLPIHVMQTYYAALKSTPQKIERQIKKRNLNQNSIIIIPINQDYHWFFLVIYDRKIFIFDSILPKSSRKEQIITKNQYAMKSSVKRCFLLFEKLYNIEQFLTKNLELVKYYPQQDNQNDCGMMMLCGIKNILSKFCENKKNYKQEEFKTQMWHKENYWIFCNHDIKFYRMLFARQIIEETLFDF